MSRAKIVNASRRVQVLMKHSLTTAFYSESHSSCTMIIPINLHLEPSPSSSSTCTFPPALAQFGSEGLVLIELQGSLEVEGDNIGQTVGKLSAEASTVSCYRCLTGIEVNRMFTEETHFTDRTPSTGRQTRESAETPCCSSSFITRT